MRVPWMAPITAQQSSAGDDRQPPRASSGRRGAAARAARDDAAEEAHVADREVDLAEQQDEALGHRQHDEDGALVEEVDQVLGRRNTWLGLTIVKTTATATRARIDRQDAASPLRTPGQPGAHVLAQRLGDDLRRDPTSTAGPPGQVGGRLGRRR